MLSGSANQNDTAGAAAQNDAQQAAEQQACGGTGHDFVIPLDGIAAQYGSSPLYVVVAAANGDTFTLPCAQNSCTLPGSMRIGLTNPAAAAQFLGSPQGTVFLSAKIAGGTPPYSAVTFWINDQSYAATATSDPNTFTLSTSLPSVVLPQPDSPTRPIVSPRLMVKETSSTAWMGPAGMAVYDEEATPDDEEALSATARRFEEAQRRGHPVIGGMHETLEAVGTRHRLGLITNGPSDIQRLKLEQAGLTGAFAAEVISGELGIGKPRPEVFHGLLERLDVAPEASVMVGDSWERAVEGALAAGMSAVWIGAGRTPPAEHERLTVIDSVVELEGVLD